MKRAGLATIAGCAILSGCTVPILPTVTDTPGKHQAFYDSFPALLFNAAEAACQSPADTFKRLGRGSIRCETLPSPSAAATLILQYDGDLENLPILVNQLTAVEQEDGLKVTVQYFFEVPQLDGGLRRIAMREPRIDETISNVIILSGGQPPAIEATE